MKKLIPALIALIGLVGGAVGGAMMKSGGGEAKAQSHYAEAGDHGDKGGHGDDGHGAKGDAYAEGEYIYVGLERPFFAPISHGSTNALVRIDLHLEVKPDLKDKVAKHEPKLRDAFLRAVLDFSEKGGFSRIRAGDGFDILRDDFLVSARRILGPSVKNVLIGEILTRNG